MLPVVLELAFVELVFSLGVELAESALLTADPLALVVVSYIPHVLTLSMPLVCHEVALVVSVRHDDPSMAMLRTF